MQAQSPINASDTLVEAYSKISYFSRSSRALESYVSLSDLQQMTFNIFFAFKAVSPFCQKEISSELYNLSAKIKSTHAFADEGEKFADLIIGRLKISQQTKQANPKVTECTASRAQNGDDTFAKLNEYQSSGDLSTVIKLVPLKSFITKCLNRIKKVEDVVERKELVDQLENLNKKIETTVAYGNSRTAYAKNLQVQIDLQRKWIAENEPDTEAMSVEEINSIISQSGKLSETISFGDLSQLIKSSLLQVQKEENLDLKKVLLAQLDELAQFIESTFAFGEEGLALVKSLQEKMSILQQAIADKEVQSDVVMDLGRTVVSREEKPKLKLVLDLTSLQQLDVLTLQQAKTIYFEMQKASIIAQKIMIDEIEKAALPADAIYQVMQYVDEGILPFGLTCKNVMRIAQYYVTNYVKATSIKNCVVEWNKWRMTAKNEDFPPLPLGWFTSLVYKKDDQFVYGLVLKSIVVENAATSTTCQSMYQFYSRKCEEYEAQRQAEVRGREDYESKKEKYEKELAVPLPRYTIAEDFFSNKFFQKGLDWQVEKSHWVKLPKQLERNDPMNRAMIESRGYQSSPNIVSLLTVMFTYHLITKELLYKPKHHYNSDKKIIFAEGEPLNTVDRYDMKKNHTGDAKVLSILKRGKSATVDSEKIKIDKPDKDNKYSEKYTHYKEFVKGENVTLTCKHDGTVTMDFDAGIEETSIMQVQTYPSDALEEKRAMFQTTLLSRNSDNK